MVFDTKFLDSLSEQAKVNPRLRQMYDLRNSSEDNTQRFLNALEPGTILPIHKHPSCNTVIILLRGAIRHFEYDDNGNVTEQADIKQEGGFQPLIMIEANKWHNLECLESGTVIFEHKDAKYDPETEYLKIASKKQHFTSICKIKKIYLVPLSYRIFSPGRFI